MEIRLATGLAWLKNFAVIFIASFSAICLCVSFLVATKVFLDDQIFDTKVYVFAKAVEYVCKAFLVKTVIGCSCLGAIAATKAMFDSAGK